MPEPVRHPATGEVVTRRNSLVDGYPMPPCKQRFWDSLELHTARVDPGPSPAGNPGPYLHVHRTSTDGKGWDTWHRIYRRPDRRVKAWREWAAKVGLERLTAATEEVDRG